VYLGHVVDSFVDMPAGPCVAGSNPTVGAGLLDETV
jgi:hypothetical protein